MIPDDVVDRVREEADIVSIIGEFVKLKRVGNSYRGPCPFHHGKDANFSVTTKGGYKCFVCGEAGDVFTFVRKQIGLEFVDAVKWVGEKAGVEVHDDARRTDERDAREPLWEVNATASDFFRTRLWDSADGKVARDYLASRGLAREDADRFGVGYAPRDDSMSEALRALGFENDRQLEAGLLHVREDRPEPRPRFRGRLIFPIYDSAGHIVGFGGRSLGDAEPKYLNSAESEIFSKRKLLYGLNWAKQAIRKADRLLIVEGYFDVIRLMLAGITEVVATLGTALAEQQAALIRKYTKNVFLLYDSDQAGLKATFRAGDALLANGVSVRVVSLPDGEDPDTFAAKFGTDGIEHAANASVDVFDRKIQILERGGWFGDLRRKRQALDKLVPTIRVTSDRLLRDLYIARTSEVAGVSRDLLVRELEAAPQEGRPREPQQQRAPAETGAPPADVSGGTPHVRRGDRRANHQRRGDGAERVLLRMLLHHRRHVESAVERIGVDAFGDATHRAIFVALASHSPSAAVDDLVAALDNDATAVVQELLDESGGIDRAEETIEASINALLSRPIAARLTDIDRLLPLADSDQKDDLIREKGRLRDDMAALGHPRWKHFDSTRS